MTGAYSDEWHLAGSVVYSLGAWLVTNYGLDDRWGQGPWNAASSTRAKGQRWLREQLDSEHGSRVPVRYAEQHDGRLIFVYVNRKHIPEEEES